MLRGRIASRRFAADTQGYGAIRRESGTPGEKCPKFAQGGWNGFPPPKEALVVARLSQGKRLNLGIDGWYRLMPDD